MTTGQRIRMRREQLHISQRELAAKLGYKNNSTLSCIESDKVEPGQKKLAELARILNVSIPWLMCLDNTEQPILAEKDELSVLLESATKEQKEEILRYAQYIMSQKK